MSETPVEKKIRKRGSRLQVLHGEALMTSGGLTKEHLSLNEKTGKICSMAEIQRGISLSSKMRQKRAEAKPIDAIANCVDTIEKTDIIDEITVEIKPKRVRKPREKKRVEAPIADE
jgi:DVNP family